VALGIVDSVYRELPRVLGGVAPEHLDIACGASVLLCFLQALDVLYPQVALMPLGSVNALIGLELPFDVFAGNSLVVIRRLVGGSTGRAG